MYGMVCTSVLYIISIACRIIIIHTLAKLPGLGYLAVKIPTHILSVSAFEGWCCSDAVAAVAVAVAVAAAGYRLQATG